MSSIALGNRVKVLEEQRAQDRKLIEQLQADLEKLKPRPVGRPPKEKPDGEVKTSDG